MFKIWNPFKKKENKKHLVQTGLGELAWQSVNLENELKVSKKVEVS